MIKTQCLLSRATFAATLAFACGPAFSAPVPAEEAAAAAKDGEQLEHSAYFPVPVDWTVMHGRVRTLLQKYPDSDPAQSLLTADLYAFACDHSPAATMAEWKDLAALPGVAGGKYGREWDRFFTAIAKPINLKVTAADGTEVDLAKLRGKVVLIDFWATWCGDCRREAPTIVAAYRKHHDRGFEIVGIALERPGLKPGDSAREAEAKVALARQKLLAFTRDHGMPWPEYCDGKGWDGELRATYGIIGVPTALLLDREGRVAAINAFGPRLETALGRLGL